MGWSGAALARLVSTVSTKLTKPIDIQIGFWITGIASINLVSIFF